MSKKRNYVIFCILTIAFVYILQLQNRRTKISGLLASRDVPTMDSMKTRLPILSPEFYQVTSETEILDSLETEVAILSTNLPQGESEVVDITKTELRSCATFPTSDEIELHNEYWQTYRNKNISFQLYGAYLDKRARVEKGPMVRILAMINQNEASFPPSYCRLWFSEQTESTVVPVSEYISIWPKKWGNNANNSFPHLVGCTLPTTEDSEHIIPEFVSLLDEVCSQPSNNLNVQFEEPRLEETKQGFAVCVKGLNFPDVDISDRLIEWLEMMRILGADKVFIYNLDVHPNITKVLDYYQESGFVEVTPFIMADGVLGSENIQVRGTNEKNFRKRLNELIPYNDCFYKHVYQYDYIALVDIDEVIMPLGNLSNWRDIIVAAKHAQKPNCTTAASICFRNVFFPTYQELESVPFDPVWSQRFYMLDHVHRLPEHSRIGSATKCLHNTEHVVSLHNHYPRKWLLHSCAPQTVNISVAQLQHYREVKKRGPLAEAVFDDNIWRYSALLVNRSMAVFQQLALS